jgi:hypothetical protein
MGLFLASLAAGLMNWLWPEIRIPVFIASLISWVFNSIDTATAEREGIVRTSASGWKYVKPSDVKKEDPTKHICGDIASILLGVVIAFIMAGLVGLWWQAIRWLIFGVVVALWTATIVVGAVGAWRERPID